MSATMVNAYDWLSTACEAFTLAAYQAVLAAEEGRARTDNEKAEVEALLHQAARKAEAWGNRKGESARLPRARTRRGPTL